MRPLAALRSMKPVEHPKADTLAGAPRGARFACRFCAAPLTTTFVDLGMSPLCQTHIAPRSAARDGAVLSAACLCVRRCFLVQLQEFVSPGEIFTEYAYFSSYSASWVEHARRYVEPMSERFGLGRIAKVMEIASNDGYLLQHFVARGRSGARHRAGRERRAGRESRRAFRRPSGSSAPEPPQRSRANMAGRTCCSATTCSRMCRISTTSSPA